MTTIIENYLREVEASLRVDAARKRQIVDELRTHLTEKVADMQAAQPDRSVFEIEQEILREFGNPRDLALAYEPEGTTVLTNAAGDIVLRVGKAVGRGAVAVGRNTGTFLKWTAVALGILLVISLGVGAWAYYEVKPYIPAMIESSDPVYEYYERCAATPCNGVLPADTFYVRPSAQTVKFQLSVYSVHPQDGDDDRHVGNGTLRLVVSDAEGVARLDRVLNLTNEGYLHHEVSWASAEGNWTVAYEYTDFVGAIDVQAYAITMPLNER